MKRGLDLCLSVSLLVLSTPLLALIAVAVKTTSSGPVFITQERVGPGDTLFRMFKFRTMRVDAEVSPAAWTTPNDSRRTPLGKFLRRLSLDELPQLWNVARGEMSLVGPRPERPALVREFRKAVPGYMLRHRVKGGMTGWAQVNGWRGNTSLAQRLEHDLFYIEHRSLAFDLKILWLTIWRGFFHPNAY